MRNRHIKRAVVLILAAVGMNRFMIDPISIDRHKIGRPPNLYERKPPGILRHNSLKYC